MKTMLRRASLSVIFASIMVVAALAVIGPTPTTAQSTAYDQDGMGSDGNGARVDSALRELMLESDGPFDVYVIAEDRAAANTVLTSRGLPEIASREFAGMPTVSLMALDAGTISALAAADGVTSILAFEKPSVDESKAELLRDSVSVDSLVPAPEDYDIDVVHGAVDAWESGYDGEGVLLAVIDDGFDMAHPDMQGQQARHESGPYMGWPIAYDDYAALQWKNGNIGGWMADTTTEVAAKKGAHVLFDGVKYKVKGLMDIEGNKVMSMSGTYHIGYHPDPTLAALWGGPVAVLVVDSVDSGVYDTVYVDVLRDFSFTNDKPCTMGDEISYFDLYDATTGLTDTSAWNAGDGFADYSGGMAYWIADGINVYPASGWTYGAEFKAEAGDAVAFMGAYAGTHGTMTSSSAVAQGLTMGGQLGGMAPGARLICIPFTGSTVNAWMFAQFGADGTPGTGDEATLVTNSYGWSDTAVDAGYTELDMIMTTISMQGPTLWFWSTGNGGPGYGTVHSIVDATSVHVGAGTTMQYRYWLGYETIPGEQKWGDVAPFSNSGPGRNGKLNAEIIASGMYSLEPMPLNIADELGTIGNGAAHLQVGSGTSHATPTTAGGAALGYQAFMETFGGAPDKDYAKAVLMAAADDMHYDPFKQGAGWLNAGTYADAMSGSDGVVSMVDGELFAKAALYPGGLNGVSYEMSPNFILPGESDVELVTTTNLGDEDVTVDISSQLLLRDPLETDVIESVTKTTGDIMLDVTEYIPEGTDLLKVTMFMPLEQLDPNMDYVQDFEYWLEVHDWVDLNGNGILNVKGSNWELLRFSVDGSQCNANQIMIKDPLDRITDGMIVRVRAIVPTAGIDISIQLDYYTLQPFPWAQARLSGSEDWESSLSADVPAGGQVSWELKVTVPEDAPVGSYGAAVYIDDESRVQSIPILVNVPATDYEFEFGGDSLFDTPYNNDVVGESDKWWRFEVGDWRIYWSVPSEMPDENAYLMTSVDWEELPTDINIHVLAPIAVDPDAANEQIFAAPYGPGFYQTGIASSDERYMGAGIFASWTNTGGPKEVIAAPLGAYENALGAPAPFAIVLRCPLMAGDEAREQFDGVTKWVVLNDLNPSSVDLTVDLSDGDSASGTIDAYYDITVDGTVDVLGGGVDPTIATQWDSIPIYQDVLSSDFVADLANAAYTMPISVATASILIVSVWEVENCPDIDLGLWYDANMDGVATLDEPYWYVGMGGSSETLTLRDIADGQYLIKVLGYTVSGDPGYFGLSVMQGIQGASILASGFDSLVGSGAHEFVIEWSVPAVPGIYVGAATFGFLGSADMFRIEVRITVVE